MARPCALSAIVFLLAAAAALSGCAPAPQPDAAGGLLLPALATRQDQVQALRLRGAGGKELVSLARDRGAWRLRQRGDWPADGARIARYLATLAQARRAEAKTASAVMYPRLGVEDVADPEAAGTELELTGRDIHARLLVGKTHKLSGGRYVRVDGGARAWLSDVDVGFDPDPVSWLDRRLFSIPLARVDHVRIRPRNSAAFSLVSRDDRFRPDDAPSGAMHDSHAGDAIASALQEFDFEDVAADDGRAQASQQLDFALVDGVVLSIGIWRQELRDWARVSATLDAARAQAWAAQAGQPELSDKARAAVADWNARCKGRRFLLPPALATTLMLDHSQILEGTPETTP